MNFSRIVLVLSLAVLALVLFNTLSTNDNPYENYENIEEPFNEPLEEHFADNEVEEKINDIVENNLTSGETVEEKINDIVKNNNTFF